MTDRGKKIYTALAGILLLALYFVIFGFSAQDGETSGGISMKVSRFGVELWNDVTMRGWTEQIISELAAFFEHPVRKGAHFAEYALMGFLQYSILKCHIRKGWLVFLLTTVWIMVSAAFDELHQYFVPGRWGSIADVLLDTCGGIFGALSCVCLIQIILKCQKRCKKLHNKED